MTYFFICIIAILVACGWIFIINRAIVYIAARIQRRYQKKQKKYPTAGNNPHLN